MEPITGIALVVALILGATACSDDKKGDGVDAGTDIDIDVDSDSDTDTDVDAGFEPDPWDRDGFNAFFSDPKVNSMPMKVVDLDVNRVAYPNILTLMGGYALNRKGDYELNELNPMASANPAFGTNSHNYLQSELGTGEEIHPHQVVRLSSEMFVAPAHIESDLVDGGVDFKSGLYFIDTTAFSNEDNVSSDVLDVLQYAGDAGPAEEEVQPYDIRSAAMYDGSFYAAATEESDDSGMLLGFSMSSNGTIDMGDLHTLVGTQGEKPTSMADLGGGRFAILNGGGTYGASMVIVNAVTGTVESSLVLPFAEAVPLAELSTTPDGQYAVVAGGSGDQLSTLVFVGLSTPLSIEGVVDIMDTDAEVRGMDVIGDIAYVSVEEKVPSSVSGKVAIVDFDVGGGSSSISVRALIDVGYDIGAIAIHGSGVAYVAVTDRWWEVVGTAIERWSHVVAFDPDEVTDSEADDSQATN